LAAVTSPAKAGPVTARATARANIEIRVFIGFLHMVFCKTLETPNRETGSDLCASVTVKLAPSSKRKPRTEGERGFRILIRRDFRKEGEGTSPILRLKLLSRDGSQNSGAPVARRTPPFAWNLNCHIASPGS
jgi:hypothetical protein